VRRFELALPDTLEACQQALADGPDYRKLTAADANIETIMVEVPAPDGPFGARGVGEPPIVAAPAAIANAIEDATGLRLVDLPLTPEKIALGLAASQT
jgi:CO/xanthine dehydrogenase Mo-binding subunit